MRIAILGFALGIGWLQWQPALPALAWLLGGGAAGLLLAALPLATGRWRAALPVGAFFLGIAWAGIAAQQRLADALAAEAEGRDTAVVGVVATMPQRFENGVRFEFDIEQAPAGIPPRVSLAWYRGWRGSDESEEPQPVHAGERWRFVVRLKRPHGNVNPHGYDYEAALLERGIRATGYIRRDDGNARVDAFVARPGYAVERLRENLRERYRRALGNSPYAGVLIALALGDQRGIEAGS